MSQVSIKLTPRDIVGLPYAPSNNANTILLFQQFFKGDQGIQGIQGKSAYQVWLDDGHTGTEEEFFNYIDPDVTKSSLGLGNVDNTADIDKPTSEPQAADIVAAIDTIKAGVPTDGDNLNKLNDKILSILFKLYSINPTISSDFENQEYKLYEVPSGLSTKALTDIWTVTRGSSATITDACGLVRTVSANVPRITYDILGRASLLVEEARTNLFLHPRNFNLSSWTNSGTSITGSRWFSNGMFGYKVTEDATTGSHLLIQSVTYATGNAYSLTYIVTSPTSRTFRLQMASVAGAFPSFQQVRFDCSTLTATVLSGTGTASVIALEDGLFKLTFNTNVTTSTLAMNTNLYTELSNAVSYAGDGTTGYYIAYAQVEASASSTSIIPDATTFTSRASTKYVSDATGALVQVLTDVKAMAYNPANLNAEPVALYEVASTNLLANRDTMATETVTVVSGQTYTLSFDGTGSVQLSGANATNVVGLGAGLANQKTFTFVASTTSLTLTVTGSCLRGQLENLPYATSRIPNAMVSGVRAADVTTGVQATRAADSVVRTLGKEFNPIGFSWFFDYTPLSLNGTFGGLANTFADTIYLTSTNLFIRENNVGIPNAPITNTINTRARLMVTYSNKVYKVFFNGALLATRTGTIEQVNYLRLRIAIAPWSFASASDANLNIHKSQLYHRALSEADAILRTS